MIAFDTETTGLLHPDGTRLFNQPFIIEFYACKFNKSGKIISEFETFLKPPIPLPEIITKITGITDSDLKDAPNFLEIYDELSDFFLGEKDIFAHNCSFDINILKNELMRYEKEFKFPWPKNHYCTVELSHTIQNKRLKLEQLYFIATGKTFDAHRAKADTAALVECIIWLGENDFIKNW